MGAEEQAAMEEAELAADQKEDQEALQAWDAQNVESPTFQKNPDSPI